MKLTLNHHRILITPLLLSIMLLSGCGDDSTGPGETQITGTLVAHSSCGGFDYAATLATAIPTDQSGVAWEWDGKGVLKLRHLNGAFNCCPDISCEITLNERVLTVAEMDAGMCDCICLTDADFQVTGLTAGMYTIKLAEMYLLESDPKIEFSVSLTSLPASDTVVVDRDHYPWMPAAPSMGSVTDFSDCGGFASARLYADPPDDSVCVSWEYDDFTLYLTHHNMIYNCGLYDVSAYITVDTGMIWIDERAMINPVHCWCEFDIDMEIPHLSPGYYGVALATSLWNGSTWLPYWDTVHFMIDLTGEEPGYHCYSTVPIID